MSQEVVVLMSALAAVVMCGKPLRAEIAKPEQPQAMFPVGLGEKPVVNTSWYAEEVCGCCEACPPGFNSDSLVLTSKLSVPLVCVLGMSHTQPHCHHTHSACQSGGSL